MYHIDTLKQILYFRFKTEAEVFKWSFVFEKFVSDDIKEEISNSVKGKNGIKYYRQGATLNNTG